MTEDRKTLTDFIAQELRAIAGPCQGKTRAEAEPQLRKAIAGFLTDQARAASTTEVTTRPSPDGGIDITVRTNDPALIERLVNAGAVAGRGSEET